MTATLAPHLVHRLPTAIPRAVAWLRAAARRVVTRPGLPVLDEVHPAAPLGTRVDVGVHAIAIEDIRGTAAGGPRLRGADFRPVEDLRTGGWRIRYERLRTAIERMAALPPIEVLEVGGEYWVVDGHNRVALAREQRLAFLDANVTGIRWPGGPEPQVRAASLGAVLEASAQQRAAASDRWRASSAASLPQRSGWRPTAGTACAAC